MTAETQRYIIDCLERVVWTLIQVSAGAILDVLISGEITWKAILYAVAIAVLKVIVAGQVGKRKTAQALPGGTYDNGGVPGT